MPAIVKAHKSMVRLRGWMQLFLLKRMGLNARRARLDGFYHWPWMAMGRLQLGDQVHLGNRGRFIIGPYGRIFIGDRSYLSGAFTILSAMAPIVIGEDCLLAFNVTLVNSAHRLGPGINPVDSGIVPSSPIHIGNRCFIGCNTTILEGVTLGDNCIVGAGAVVTRSFPDNSTIGGNPAHIL